jgi:hypothetical protein
MLNWKDRHKPFEVYVMEIWLRTNISVKIMQGSDL